MSMFLSPHVLIGLRRKKAKKGDCFVGAAFGRGIHHFFECWRGFDGMAESVSLRRCVLSESPGWEAVP